MNILARKIRHTPSRVFSCSRNIAYVARQAIESARAAAAVARLKRNTRISGAGKSGTVVVNAARSWPVSDIESYLAYLLTLSGSIVHVLFDDGVLEHWDSGQFHDVKYYSPYRTQWYIKAHHGIRKRLVWRAYRESRMRMINYSAIVKSMPPAGTVENEDVSYAMSSTKRFFETGIVDVQGEHRDYYEKSLANCRISRAIAGYVLERLQPDLYITSHGIYSIWGPAYRLIKEAGVPTIIWQVAPTVTGRIRLIDRQDQVLASTEDWRGFDSGTPLTEKIRGKGRALLDARCNLQTEDTKEYFAGRLDPSSLDGLAGSWEGVSFGMFPNVAWDGDVPERNLFFDNVVEWCIFSINAIRDTPHHLYIRFHPSETTRLAGSVKLQSIVRQRIPDVDAMTNVTMIDSTEGLNTYAFARKHVDVGLIYDGTLCLELTHLGIPVIACTNGNVTLESVVFKPASREQYRDWLSEPKRVLGRFADERESRCTMAAKYAYWLFEESLLEFKPLAGPYPPRIDYDLVKADKPMSCDQQRIYDRLVKPLKGPRG